MKTEIQLGLFDGDAQIDIIQTNFIGPAIINK